MPGTPRASRFGRLAAFGAGLGLFGAACAANAAPPAIPVKVEGQLVAHVVDTLNDAGRAPSVALDKDGNPTAVYLLLKEIPKKGQVPPPPLAGQPQPPAVLMASHANGVWTRASVTKQSEQPAVGVAEGISFQDGTAGPPVHTSVAIDAQGKHHVAWSSAAALFYNADSTGAFGDPQKVVEGQTFGAAMALAPDGSPWISFYQSSGLRAAHLVAGSWQVEDVAPGVTSGTAVVSAVGVGSNGEPMIAYGDHDTTKLARRSGGSWTSEAVPGAGGLGVSMAVDADGNPHLAYYDASGHVRHAHSINGGAWDVTDIAAVKGATGVSDRWATGIALDGKGIHYVTWADTGTNQVYLATNSGGSFNPTAVADSQGGATPAIAVSPDGKNLALAWYDPVDTDAVVAMSANAGLLLAFSPPPPAATVAPSPTASCSPNGTTVKVAAKGIAFDAKCLAAPAKKAFKIVFENQDASIPHNVDVYKDPSASQHLGGATGPGDIVSGPATVTYNVDPLPAGTYYFQCDVHPQQMNGTFVVAKK